MLHSQLYFAGYLHVYCLFPPGNGSSHCVLIGGAQKKFPEAMIGHPPPALVQPHWPSLCLVFPKFIPTSGPLHRHTGAHIPVCTHHGHMCRVIHPSGPQSPSPACWDNPLLTVCAPGWPGDPTEGLATGLVGLSGVLWPVPLPTLRGWHCPRVCYMVT